MWERARVVVGGADTVRFLLLANGRTPTEGHKKESSHWSSRLIRHSILKKGKTISADAFFCRYGTFNVLKKNN